MLIQGVIMLLPSVDTETRMAILLYSVLPASFLTSGLGKTEEEFAVASGVCSLLTIVCLVIFGIIAICVA